jgi:hypothetical protein
VEGITIAPTAILGFPESSSGFAYHGAFIAIVGSKNEEKKKKINLFTSSSSSSFISSPLPLFSAFLSH